MLSRCIRVRRRGLRTAWRPWSSLEELGVRTGNNSLGVTTTRVSHQFLHGDEDGILVRESRYRERERVEYEEQCEERERGERVSISLL